MPTRFLLFAAVMIMSRPVSADPSEIAVHIDETGGVVVPVTINGRGPFPFLLDTGSSHSVVSRSLAEQLSLQFVAKTSVLTSTGREWRPVVTLDQTTIGDTRSEGLLASVTPSAQLHAIVRGVEGIIGQDFLFGLNYTLDYRAKRLMWSDGRSDAGGTRVPLVVHAGRYLVQVTSARHEQPVLLVPDSGASGFVAYERNGRTKLALQPAAGITSVHSLSGGQMVRTMMLGELRLGDLTLKEQPVAVVTRDASDAVEGDGILPLHLFASVSFNARDGYLLLRGASGTAARPE
jgi:hypothetical protein